MSLSNKIILLFFISSYAIAEVDCRQIERFPNWAVDLGIADRCQIPHSEGTIQGCGRSPELDQVIRSDRTVRNTTIFYNQLSEVNARTFLPPGLFNYLRRVECARQQMREENVPREQRSARLAALRTSANPFCHGSFPTGRVRLEVLANPESEENQRIASVAWENCRRYRIPNLLLVPDSQGQESALEPAHARVVHDCSGQHIQLSIPNRSGVHLARRSLKRSLTEALHSVSEGNNYRVLEQESRRIQSEIQIGVARSTIRSISPRGELPRAQSLSLGQFHRPIANGPGPTGGIERSVRIDEGIDTDARIQNIPVIGDPSVIRITGAGYAMSDSCITQARHCAMDLRDPNSVAGYCEGANPPTNRRDFIRQFNETQNAAQNRLSEGQSEQDQDSPNNLQVDSNRTPPSLRSCENTQVPALRENTLRRLCGENYLEQNQRRQYITLTTVVRDEIETTTEVEVDMATQSVNEILDDTRGVLDLSRTWFDAAADEFFYDEVAKEVVKKVFAAYAQSFLTSRRLAPIDCGTDPQGERAQRERRSIATMLSSDLEISMGRPSGGGYQGAHSCMQNLDLDSWWRDQRYRLVETAWRMRCSFNLSERNRSNLVASCNGTPIVSQSGEGDTPLTNQRWRRIQNNHGRSLARASSQLQLIEARLRELRRASPIYRIHMEHLEECQNVPVRIDEVVNNCIHPENYNRSMRRVSEIFHRLSAAKRSIVAQYPELVLSSSIYRPGDTLTAYASELGSILEGAATGGRDREIQNYTRWGPQPIGNPSRLPELPLSMQRRRVRCEGNLVNSEGLPLYCEVDPTPSFMDEESYLGTQDKLRQMQSAVIYDNLCSDPKGFVHQLIANQSPLVDDFLRNHEDRFPLFCFAKQNLEREQNSRALRDGALIATSIVVGLGAAPFSGGASLAMMAAASGIGMGLSGINYAEAGSARSLVQNLHQACLVGIDRVQEAETFAHEAAMEFLINGGLELAGWGAEAAQGIYRSVTESRRLERAILAEGIDFRNGGILDPRYADQFANDVLESARRQRADGLAQEAALLTQATSRSTSSVTPNTLEQLLGETFENLSQAHRQTIEDLQTRLNLLRARGQAAQAEEIEQELLRFFRQCR